MQTVALPYKLQIFIPEDLRRDLKEMAHQQEKSLQKLVTEVLVQAVEANQKRRAAVSP